AIDQTTFGRLARRGAALPNVRALMWFEPEARVEGEATPGRAARFAPIVAGAGPRYSAHFDDAQTAPAAERNVDPEQRGIFEQAYRTGKLQLSAPVHTANFPYEPALYQVVIPVPTSRGPAAEPAPLRGFLVAVYPAQPIVAAV